jgi:predicted CXXCH cytochrome family protein
MRARWSQSYQGMIGGAIVLPLVTLAWAMNADRQAPATTQPARQESATRPSIASPHWSEAGCVACHRFTGDRPNSIPRERIDALCLRCHNGRLARAERHPIGRTFDVPNLSKPPDWPTVDGRLGCVTCHEIITACRHPARPVRNAAFVRGFNPDAPLRFCAHCHEARAYHRYDPHRMLDDDGKTIEGACLTCHTRAMARDVKTRTGHAALRSDGITLCVGCHNRHVDWFEPGHIGAMLNEKVKAQLARRATAIGDRLPTEAPGRVVCATCHNPHQAGVFPPDSVLAHGGQRVDVAHRAPALRGLGKELCLACHNQ